MEENPQRLEQFSEEIAELKLKAPTDSSERPISFAGIGLVIAAFVVILVGYWGASGSNQPSEQLPYVISGGLLGVALAAVGGVLVMRSSITRYLRFWFVRMIYEQRVQTDRTVEALGRIEAGLGGTAGPGPGQPPS